MKRRLCLPQCCGRWPDHSIGSGPRALFRGRKWVCGCSVGKSRVGSPSYLFYIGSMNSSATKLRWLSLIMTQNSSLDELLRQGSVWRGDGRRREDRWPTGWPGLDRLTGGGWPRDALVELFTDAGNDPCELRILEEQEVDGRKLPKRILVQNGDQDFGEIELTTFQFDGDKDA